MRASVSFALLCLALQLPLICAAAPQETTAAGISEALGQISADPKQTFRVRDVQLLRGDIKIYLTEGVLSFLTPVSGKTVAAVWSTDAVEAGDAEIIVLPPQRNERASLAAFTKTPNLDEHFASALFLFTDDTAQDLLAQIQARPVRNLPDVAAQIAPSVHELVQQIGADMRGQLVAGLLDNHPPHEGFFYGVIGGKTLGRFDVLYAPSEFEEITIGRGNRLTPAGSTFELWTSFRSRHSGPYKPAEPAISDYRIRAEIGSDLAFSADARFHWLAKATNGRVIPLWIAEKLKVDSARVDDHPVEVFQLSTGESALLNRAPQFFLITDAPVPAGSAHTIDIHYHGAIIRKAGTGAYFVDDRNAWYPFAHPTLAHFDLTFLCPEDLELVSTGEPISDESQNGIRTVHRVTRVPEALAGFNLGHYAVTAEDHGPYRVETYSDKGYETPTIDIPQEMNVLLDYYTNRWTQLPIHNIAVTPIPASFGQGFPGLIYLSAMAYARPEDRPSNFRSATFDQFFSGLLLPHEVAHQWWGNIVTTADYRSAWITEAFANESALQFIAKTKGQAEADAVLNNYRDDLVRNGSGKTIESYGPLEFGVRLMDSAGPDIWHTIMYEKGTWVMEMLRQRLGDGFLKLQLRLLHDFAGRPLTNDEFRKVASEFVPAGQPDRTLSSFFESWIYGTGIPRLEIKGQDVIASHVDEDFTADVPLQCHGKNGPSRIRWFRLSSGVNSLDLTPGSTCELPAANAFLYLPAGKP
jgi:hypothetical protein